MPDDLRAVTLSTADAADLTQTLARWAARTRYEDLPSAAVDAAKKLALDSLGCAWAGAGLDGVDAVADLLFDRGGRGESAVWARGGRLPAPAAALLNGMSSAALDFDTV